jgi:hypothetical protein
LIIVTLRRAGLFDPVQFFRTGLIQISSTSAKLAHKAHCRAEDRGKTTDNTGLIASACGETPCFDVRRFIAFATIVAEMPRFHEN